jgi:two-component system KDP operon response regulator KdpE
MIHHNQRHRRESAVFPRLPHENVPAIHLHEELSLDFQKRLFTVRGKRVHLAPKEVAVLRQLVASGGDPMSHQQLLQAVWGPEYDDEIELLRVVVCELRKKIEHNPAKPKYIQTEPCIGYRFTCARDAQIGGLHE